MARAICISEKLALGQISCNTCTLKLPTAPGNTEGRVVPLVLGKLKKNIQN